MVTLAKDTPRDHELGIVNEFPVIASDIIYEGAAGGLVIASGHCRPLTSVDPFCGFAEQKADNSAGSAADINCRFKRKGAIKLSVSGAVITDINQPVYATDDDTFVFLPTGAQFIGYVRRFISSGVVIVEYDVDNYVDPYGDGPRATLAGTITFDIQDTAKTFFATTDGDLITLLTYAAATAAIFKVVNIGAYGTLLVDITPAAGDKISGPDDTGADAGNLANTKATAQRGDYAVISSGGDDGYIIEDIKGTWTIA